ncbi:MAG: 3-dehydroquinate synthase [Clostridiales bacterium]|nr:3-dehydroquinate synthase [Clostridiales bacterium]
MPTINVALGDRAYPIHIEAGLINRVGFHAREILGDCALAIITDDNVAPLYLQRVQASLDAAGLRHTSIVLPHGEPTKCLAQLSNLYDFLCGSRITRKDAIIALGGGVIGDLAGLAAATFLRGVRFIQVPTTLLAQVDSSVGGKVAVDLPQGKNLVGAFYQPAAVLCDPLTLNTLTDDFWRDGMGEVVKYGCICDEELFALLEKCASGGRGALMDHIDLILQRCIQAKADVVAQDEHDTGLRMTLNFGHTIGHAVETCQHYDGLRHGEAVALGMSVMTRLTEARGMTAPGTARRLDTLLAALNMPLRLPDIPADDLIAAMGMDKKSAGKTLRVIVLDGIGSCRIHATDVDFFRDMG